MHFSSRHIAPVGRLLLVLFFLSNAGLTFVVQRCSMGGASKGMACCDDQNQSAARACAIPDPDKAIHIPLVADTAGCMVVTVVGGLQTDPKFVEQEPAGPHVAKVDVLSAPATAIMSGLAVGRPFCVPLSTDSRVSPISVEKYVLSGSFLI